ncbi:hypothetical protein MRB53_021126 [Persea americana]|uniref:Uncharacterized protein n=1 Tax=Persea americana TaxID=3435 RepID=A0ACC2L2Y0_PERAE|nr:hypothetical protein MRB53_021126 [Persea americana]
MAKTTFCNFLLLPESMFLQFTINCGSLQLIFSGHNHRSPSGSLFRLSSLPISNTQASAALCSSSLLPDFFSEPGAQFLAPQPLIFLIFSSNAWAESLDPFLFGDDQHRSLGSFPT